MIPELQDVIVNRLKLYDKMRLEIVTPRGVHGPTYEEMRQIITERDIRVIIGVFQKYFYLLHICFDVILDDEKLIDLRKHLIDCYQPIIKRVFPYAYDIDKSYMEMTNDWTFICMAWHRSGKEVWLDYLISLGDPERQHLFEYIEKFAYHPPECDMYEFADDIFNLQKYFMMSLDKRKELVRVAGSAASYHRGCLQCLLLRDKINSCPITL